MTDITSIITIVIVLVVIYYLVKFIISPLIKLAAGIIIFLVAIYILQNYFHFNLSQALGPIAPYLNVNQWVKDFMWLVNYGISYINQAISFFQILLKNVPHGTK